MGDFSANFQRPETGIHTVEGNVAGSRAAALTKRREAQQQSFEQRKLQIQSDSARGRKNIDEKFNSDAHLTVAERTFREKTVGLVSAEDFKKASLESAELAKKKRQGLEGGGDDDEGGEGGNDVVLSKEKMEQIEKQLKKERKKERKKRKKMLSTLSFADAEDADGIVPTVGSSIAIATSTPGYDKFKDDEKEEKEDGAPTIKEIKKNPDVDTSFLPDKEREAALATERRRLRKEWVSRQQQIKEEMLEITYSYWDGSGHRRTVNCRKGDSIGMFLELVRKDLAKEFREMQNVTSDALLYVKEDLIIPQDITFYDLIVTKARGKSGPLFNFDVHDDVRVGAIDSRIEKDESHPGKVVERRWYDRNKHIFPASRWEIFDPAKDYGTYTIHGGEINKKRKK